VLRGYVEALEESLVVMALTDGFPVDDVARFLDGLPKLLTRVFQELGVAPEVRAWFQARLVVHVGTALRNLLSTSPALDAREPFRAARRWLGRRLPELPPVSG
jgi:hypothetical protein